MQTKAKLTYTVAELSKQMQISLPKAYEMTERKGFPIIRVGRRKLIPVEALNEWLMQEAQRA